MSDSGDGINAAAAMTGDGMVIASILDPDVDPDRFALVQLMIEGTRGAVLLIRAGGDAVLAVSTNPGAILGKIFFDTRRSAQRLASLLAV